MKNEFSRSIRREYLAKIVLSGIFLLAFAGFTFWMQARGDNLSSFHISAMDLVLLGLATFRLGRLVAYDHVMEPLRLPFAKTVPDGTGAGETVEPRGTGGRRALGQLISCPICAGTWVAAILVYGLVSFPGPTRVFLAMTAAIGAAEILNAMVEALSWSGQYARTLTGRYEAAGEYAPQVEEHPSQDYEVFTDSSMPNGKNPLEDEVRGRAWLKQK